MRERLLKALTSDAYAPEDGAAATDPYRLRYATLLARHGDSAGARILVGRLTTPYWLRQASVDPTLRALLPADLDIRAATEARLVSDREMAALHGDRLEPLIDVAADLRELGRPQEALQVLQTAAAKIDDPKAFTDRDDQLAWWWDGMGDTYFELGKYDEAVAAFRKGAALPEHGQPNFSQMVNLADMQIDFGRGEEALKTLAAFDDPKRKGSPYGEMQVRFARGCARAVAGHKTEAAADLAYARAHEKDDPETLSNLLLCMGDMEGAAAVVVRRLDDPDQRVEALLQLSDYDDPPVPVPPAPLDAPLRALKERADVKAAVARAGGIRRFHVRPANI